MNTLLLSGVFFDHTVNSLIGMHLHQGAAAKLMMMHIWPLVVALLFQQVASHLASNQGVKTLGKSTVLRLLHAMKLGFCALGVLLSIGALPAILPVLQQAKEIWPTADHALLAFATVIIIPATYLLAVSIARQSIEDSIKTINKTEQPEAHNEQADTSSA